MKANDIPAPVWYVGFGVLAVAGLVWYLKSKGGLSLINPASENNVVNQGATGLLQSIGLVDEDSSIGSTLYDLLHYDYDPNAPAGSPSATQASIFAPAAQGLASAAQAVAFNPLGNLADAISKWFGSTESNQAQPNLAAPGDYRTDYVTTGSTDAAKPFSLDGVLGSYGITSASDPRYNFASY